MSLIGGFLLFLAGIVAGFVNTIAGGGSAVTIPILVDLLGASVANGTNRVAILIANVTATASYRHGGALDWAAVRPLVIPTVLGSGMGAFTASRISADSMKTVFAFVLVAVALSIALKPSRWVEPRGTSLREPWRSLAFLGIGFYGGFVQAGVGFLLLAGLVLGGGLDLVTGNAAKVALIAAYTAVALAIFASASQVDLGVGLVLAAGNSTGALVASRMAMKRGANWVRYVIIVAAVAAAIRMLLT